MFSKAILTILFTSCFLLSITAQSKTTDKLIGKWEGIDNKKEIGSLHFIDSVHIALSIPDQEVPPGTYRIDAAKNPAWFDITIGSGQGAVTLKGLLAFIDEQTIKWQIFKDGKRPDKFVAETEDNTIILKKKVSK